MHFERDIITAFRAWALRANRKPLVLRGARQVGKTTAIQMFGAEFDAFIQLNLERPEDRNLFTRFDRIDDIVSAMLLSKQVVRGAGRILVFIDEIQVEPKAVTQLRYFFEDYPDLYLIAAGSLLETLLASKNTFPVGRVEYLVMRPVSFAEFLRALGEHEALQLLNTVPLPSYAFPKLLELFHIYALIGGMPEVVAEYSRHRDLSRTVPVFSTLLTAYQDDVQKYATTSVRAQHLEFAIDTVFIEAGHRIKFHGFGNSGYASREMGEALRTLEKAMLCHLIYPLTNTGLPALPDIKKQPYLQVLDTGLMNYRCGLQTELIGTKDLNSVYQGRIIRHLVGQQMLARMLYPTDKLLFWVREQKHSEAELDFILPYKGKLIPIEVKSGKTGRLRSLSAYMDEADHQIAIRLYANEVNVHPVTTIGGKSFQLINLPYFLAERLDAYLDWAGQEYPLARD
jgi:uncharacterized protein